MGPGDRQLTMPPTGGPRRTPGRSLPLWAALVGAAIAGCGSGSSNPADDLPPLPRYWQGSIRGPQPEEWAAGWPKTMSGPAADAATIAPSSEPYVIPRMPTERTDDAPVAAVEDQRVSARTEATDVATALPTYSAGADSGNSAGSEDASLDQGPAAGAGAAVVAEAAPGVLMPPQPVVENDEPAPMDVVVVDGLPTLQPPSPEAFAQLEAPLQFPAEMPRGATMAVAPAVRREQIAASITSSTRPAAATQSSAGAPTGVIVNERATAKIRRGYELAERGAYFAARNQFVDVLRMIASAKDQLHGAPRRTLALSEGLRALDEAADFCPMAGDGAGKLAMSVIVASHQTPVAKSSAVDEMLPTQLADAYLEYAGRQLAASVAGEPAGSVALHALGKLHSRLGRVEPEKNPQADRVAFALQQAALLARSDNHLAAHELGVLLAEGGHYAESGAMLQQVAQRAPHPVVFRNLARVQQQLGRADLAAASQRQAEFLAARGEGGGSVMWVPAQTLSQTPDSMAPTPAPMMARGPAPVQR